MARRLINANGTIALAFASGVLTLSAQEQPSQFDARKATLPEWRAPRSEEFLEQKPTRLTIGKTDFVMSGALVEAFRTQPRFSGERTRMQKLVNMFVPAPMPKPGRGGKYFAWGQRDEPWATVSARASSGPQGSLISVSR